MRRTFALATVVAAVLMLVAAMPAMAGTRHDITITALTYFDSDVNDFTATGLGAACADGTVENGPVHFEFQRGINVFAGYKVFTCDESTGFVLRLNARFGGFGSVGTWAVVDAWGDLSGIAGAGDIIGGPLDGGITDNYSGTITR
jgi:hypothetical protein